MRCTGSWVAASLLAGLGWSGLAAADPIMECGLMTEDQAELRRCLDTQLEVSYQAMAAALAMARARAEALDQAAGGELATLALEGSQHAWEAFRDVNCKLHDTFASDTASADPAEASAFQRACEIELTRRRTDELVRLGEE